MNTHITRRSFLKKLGMTSAALTLTTAGCQSLSHLGGKPKRPNIMVIMADDLGYSDIGCYGGEIQTPNLNKLAYEGLRFTQFYNCSRCCPTRASLLTGQYPHQVGLTLNGRSMTRNGITIPEALKETGYSTAMVGKWHLTRTDQEPTGELQLQWLDHQIDFDRAFGPVESYPINRGFERHYGVIWGVIDHFDPFSLVDGETPIKEVPKDFYFTDAITDKAIEYIDDMSRTDQPFFMYVAHTAPHWPIHARPEDIEKYKDRYHDGWDQLRADRFQRQLKMGLFSKDNTPLPPVQTNGWDWNKLSADEKAYEARKMAVHAAMVDRVDQSTGRILDALKAHGQYDNTIIIFFADNGASPEIPGNPGYDRPSKKRDGTPLKYHNIPIDELGSEVSYTGIGAPWANACNTPFRYWKAQSYEGGNHTPMIIHWPAGLKTKSGSLTDQVGHAMDIMPTCLELAGITCPTEYQGNALTPVQGKSLVPVIAGQGEFKREPIFFEHEHGRAIRIGDWKLVANKNKPQKWELYNLAEDCTETNDLAQSNPEKAKEMADAWDDWARRIQLEDKRKNNG